MPEVSAKTMTLQVDISAMAAQMQIAAEIMKEYEPLLSKLTEQRVNQIISDFVVAMNNIVIGYYVTTIFADGARKTIRAIRYRGDIKSFTAAFWAREVCVLH